MFVTALQANFHSKVAAAAHQVMPGCKRLQAQHGGGESASSLAQQLLAAVQRAQARLLHVRQVVRQRVGSLL